MYLIAFVNFTFLG